MEANNEEADQYRAQLNQMWQTGEISKPDYKRTIEHKSRKQTVGFTGIVAFTIQETGEKVEFKCPKVETSKSVAQEKAAEIAWKSQSMPRKQSNVTITFRLVTYNTVLCPCLSRF